MECLALNLTKTFVEKYIHKIHLKNSHPVQNIMAHCSTKVKIDLGLSELNYKEKYLKGSENRFDLAGFRAIRVSSYRG